MSVMWVCGRESCVCVCVCVLAHANRARNERLAKEKAARFHRTEPSGLDRSDENEGLYALHTFTHTHTHTHTHT